MVVTNVLGVAFTATLLSASDAGAAFVFPEDGATNVLAWSRLSPASRDAVCAAADFEPLPPELAATVRQAKDELARLADLEADGRLTPEAAAVQRRRLPAVFRKACGRRGIPPARTERLLKRLFGPVASLARPGEM